MNSTLRILNRPAAPQEVEASLKLLASLKAEHDSLLTGFDQLKKKLEPEIASKEKTRQDGIDAANTALEAYKKQIAEREKKAEADRQGRYQKSQRGYCSLRQILPSKAQQWENDFHAGKSPWQDFMHRRVKSTLAGTKFEKLDDGSLFVTGKNGKADYILNGHAI